MRKTVPLIDDWLKNYKKFIKNFPQSEFNNHLKNIEFGIHKLNGDYENFVSMYSKELTKSLTKIKDQKNLNWLDEINLRSVPVIFSEHKDYTLPQYAHPKLKLAVGEPWLLLSTVFASFLPTKILRKSLLVSLKIPFLK